MTGFRGGRVLAKRTEYLPAPPSPLPISHIPLSDSTWPLSDSTRPLSDSTRPSPGRMFPGRCLTARGHPLAECPLASLGLKLLAVS